MAITTIDEALNGLRSRKQVFKTGITMAAVSGSRAYTPWYVAGNPGAGTAPSSGLSGAAVSGSSVEYTSEKAGQIPRGNPASGNAYLANLGFAATTPGRLVIIDRLWENSGLSSTLTTSQTINSVTLPARDGNGATLGAQVMAALEWSATGGAGTPTYTLGYTDSSNNAGNSTTLASVATPPVGTFEIFPLAAGDTGVRSIQTLQASATHTSGTLHLVMYREIASIGCPLANVEYAFDVITGGRPQLFNGTCPQVLWFNSATTAVTLNGFYTETHG